MHSDESQLGLASNCGSVQSQIYAWTMGRQEKQWFRRHTQKRFAQPQECFSADTPQRLCAGTCLTDCHRTAGNQQETASSLAGTWTPALPIDLWWSLRLLNTCVCSVLFPSTSSDWTVCYKPGIAGFDLSVLREEKAQKTRQGKRVLQPPLLSCRRWSNK